MFKPYTHCQLSLTADSTDYILTLLLANNQCYSVEKCKTVLPSTEANSLPNEHNVCQSVETRNIHGGTV